MGDVVVSVPLRRWGAIGNAAAIGGFLVATLASVILDRRRRVTGLDTRRYDRKDHMTSTLLDDLTADLDIPADGTLSRVLAKHGPVRLVVFAFAAGEELTEHTASVPVIIQVISGAVTIEVSGERHLLGPQSWLYLDAREPHSVYAEEPARMLLTMIRAS